MKCHKRHKISQMVGKKDQLHLIHKKGCTTGRRCNQTHGKVLVPLQEKPEAVASASCIAESLLDSPCEMNSPLTDDVSDREVILDGSTKMSKSEEDSTGHAPERARPLAELADGIHV